MAKLDAPAGTATGTSELDPRSFAGGKLVGQRRHHRGEAGERTAAVGERVQVLHLLLQVRLVAREASGRVGELRHHQHREQAEDRQRHQHDRGDGQGIRHQAAQPRDRRTEDEGEEDRHSRRQQDVAAEIERRDRHHADHREGNGAKEASLERIDGAATKRLHVEPTGGWPEEVVQAPHG